MGECNFAACKNRTSNFQTIPASLISLISLVNFNKRLQSHLWVLPLHSSVMHSRTPCAANILTSKKIKQTLILHIPEHFPSILTKAPILIFIIPYYQPNQTQFKHCNSLSALWLPLHVMCFKPLIPSYKKLPYKMTYIVILLAKQKV